MVITNLHKISYSIASQSMIDCKKIKLLIYLVICISNIVITGNVQAGNLLIETSLYTRHFGGNTSLNNHQHLLALEYQNDDDWVFGITGFQNSHNQQTEFLYAGRRWYLIKDISSLYFKLMAGALHGYAGAYKHSIPMNGSGTAPALIPSIGVDYHFLNIEVHSFYGGLMVTSGLRF